MSSFNWQWCYVTIDCVTGFATIRDLYEGLEIAELDSLEEALEFLADQPFE